MTIDENYIDEIPAYAREAECAHCGERIFRKYFGNIFCEKCLETGSDMSWEESHGELGRKENYEK
jgi:uncharacterized Zn finger protein (UPF0148 family)